MSAGGVTALEESFSAVFHVNGPYGRFQTEPAKHLLNGCNVILQAPTGAGKTKAALFPYLLARRQGLGFPRRMLYCVPMRVLARSLRDELRQVHGDLDTRLQTGDQQDDRRLEGEIIFATIDQVLSSFLNIPYALSLRQGNVNAGGVVSAYLVVDEFHLLDAESTLPTTLEMLRLLNGIAPFLLMTATFSGEMLGRLASLLNAEVVTVSEDDLASIPTQKDKQRRFHRMDTPLTADAVLASHRTRSIAICNTVERAQALFEELRHRAGSSREIILLHSRFLREHRREKEDRVRRLFGKDRLQAGSAIVVATQVIEVGLDITCEVLHTEVAPASAILQRAGRCARFEGEAGDVYVYDLPLNAKGERAYAPYLEEQAELCKKTWQVLPAIDGETVGFAVEQRLVNLVHGDTDHRMLNALEQSRYAHRQKMNKAIDQQAIGLARDLVRKDDSVTVLVHPNPGSIENPYHLEGFSFFFGSLYGQFKVWQKAGLPDATTDWLMQYPMERDNREEEDRPVRYEWTKVEKAQDLNRSATYVVNPALVTYDAETGFRFTAGGGFQSPLAAHQRVQPGREKHGYRRECYQEHVERMLEGYRAGLASEMAYAAARLERQMGLHAGSLDKAVQLAIVLHDVGKLDRRWQRWAHAWQERISRPVADDVMLVHSDYDPADPRHSRAESGMTFSRPPHAAEGAVAVFKLLHYLLGTPGPDDPRFKLMKAVFSAIGRHHSPGAETCHGFALHPAAAATIAEALKQMGADTRTDDFLVMSRGNERIGSFLVQANARDELLAYFLIVRALRLADQGAMATAAQRVSDCHRMQSE